MKSFSDILNKLIVKSRAILFMQGEMAQLTNLAYQHYSDSIANSKEEEITITYPVGLKADNTLINSTRKYSKKKLIEYYEHLFAYKLPIDGLYQLVTIIETMIGSILKEILLEYPSKISKKITVKAKDVLSGHTIEDIKLEIINNILNELTYKSLQEFSLDFNEYTGINLMELPAFHKYIEIKATRDIHIHNSGYANDIYIKKAGIMARVKTKQFLPVTIQYFLQSYESCLQLTESMEKELNNIWPSMDYRNRKQTDVSQDEIQDSVEELIKDTEKKFATPIKKKTKRPTKAKKEKIK